MARYQNGINGPFSGRVGKVVGANWRGIDYMRTVGSSPKHWSFAQINQRLRFALAMNWLNPLLALINIGYQQIKIKKTPLNAAVSYHLKHAIRAEGPDYNMYSNADYSVTPRPNYLADGRKMPDCYSEPAELRDILQDKLGQFPLFQFWGPDANIKSTKWIADAALITDELYNPTLTLIYLPHLDYCLQKFGHDFSKISKELAEVDEVVKGLVTHYEKQGASIIILSEYGIVPVSQPIHLNRIFRQNNLLQIRVERGLELLDAGASKAFVVADHQVAHIYINDPAVKEQVKSILEKTPGIALILDEEGKKKYGIAHSRAGDFVAVSKPESWFTYYFWLDDALAPDYARCVDIHKKPGYDPVEMFMSSKPRAAYKLLRKKAGFRYIMDVIPLDATLVSGSHGSVDTPREFHPVLITDSSLNKEDKKATDIFELIWKTLKQE